MIRRRGQKYHYQFVKDGKLYSGVCEGCDNKRKAEAYEKRMRDRVAAFAEQQSVDQLMERRRREITGREGISLAEAFDLSLQKPHRRAISEKKLKQKRSIWQDFVSFLAERHPEVSDLAAVTLNHAEEYISLIRTSGRFSKTVTYQRGRRTVKTSTASGAPSAATATLHQTVCAEVFNLLARDAGIAENPFAGIAKLPKDEEMREAFTPEELLLIRDNLDDFTRPLFVIAAGTALREGDICTLRWRDVDFHTRKIRRVMNKTGKLVEILMFPSVRSYLEQQYTVSGAGEYVFPELERMYRRNPSGVSYRIKSFLEGLGIETTRTPAGRTRAVSVKDLHSCRHTFCYVAGKFGVPLQVVQSICGHMSSQMTAHYMAHATEADKRQAIEAMPDFFSTSTTAPMIEADTERAALLREIEAMTTEEIKTMLNQYRRV